jgi:hypothetical protein
MASIACTEPYTQDGVEPLSAREDDLVPQTPTSFLGLISQALRAEYDKVVKEPLPKRWVELIHRLNEREAVIHAAAQDGRSWGMRGHPHRPPRPDVSRGPIASLSACLWMPCPRTLAAPPVTASHHMTAWDVGRRLRATRNLAGCAVDAPPESA